MYEAASPPARGVGKMHGKGMKSIGVFKAGPPRYPFWGWLVAAPWRPVNLAYLRHLSHSYWGESR